jgi:hypothetical protein
VLKYRGLRIVSCERAQDRGVNGRYPFTSSVPDIDLGAGRIAFAAFRRHAARAGFVSCSVGHSWPSVVAVVAAGSTAACGLGRFDVAPTCLVWRPHCFRGGGGQLVSGAGAGGLYLPMSCCFLYEQ